MRKNIGKWKSKLSAFVLSTFLTGSVVAQVPCLKIDSVNKISDTQGGFTGVLDNGDHFGQSVKMIGDLNNDGVMDIAVGAHRDDDAGTNYGAVWILLMNADGTVNSDYKIYPGVTNFSTTLNTDALFGRSIAAIGDLDNDGVEDIVVGADQFDHNSTREGAIFVLFMNSNGSVKGFKKIAENTNGFTAQIAANDNFGRSIAAVGDLDSDGIEDIVVGANHDDEGGGDRGAAYVLFMDTDGTVKSHQKISDNDGNFTGTLDDGDRFASAVAPLGDLNNDGVLDIAVVANQDDDGHSNAGAIWVLFLNSNGTVSSHAKISLLSGGFSGTVSSGANFVNSVSNVGDLDNDGSEDLLIGAWGDNEGGTNRGASWLLYLDNSGSVAGEYKLASGTQSNILGLTDNDRFGSAVSALGDFNNDGFSDFIVTAREDNDGGTGRGAIYLIYPLDSCCTSTCFDVKSNTKISDATGSLGGILTDGDGFGMATAMIGDLNQDGVQDMVVTAYKDDDGGTDRGAAYVLFMNANGTHSSYQKISDTQGNFGGVLANIDFFGRSVAGIGDLDKDGVEDIVIGADRHEGTKGAIWVLFLNANGTVKSEQKISATDGNFGGTLISGDNFGRSVASIGDLDNDGVIDLVVGANHLNDGNTDAGAVFILFMNADGTVKSEQKISSTTGGLSATLAAGDRFGSSVAGIGDLDLDGNPDIAVGSHVRDLGGVDRGAVFILFLNANGTVKSETIIGDNTGGFSSGVLSDGDYFGTSVINLGSFTPCDNSQDLAIGAFGDGDGGVRTGSVWIVSINTSGTVTDQFKISETASDFNVNLTANDYFGLALAAPGDLDKDGYKDLVVAARNDDDGGTDRGAVYTLFFDNDCDNTHAPARLRSSEVINEQGQSLLYPNPSNGRITIELPLDVETAEAVVYDVQGKSVYQSGELAGEQRKVNLDLADRLKSGVYTIRLRMNNDMKTIKMIVE